MARQLGAGDLHEDFARDEDVVGPSNRKFGITLGIIFALLASLKGYHYSPWAIVWAALSASLLALAVLSPQSLTGANRIWLKLGLLLHRVVNPLIMILMFVVAFLPIGMILRASGKDLLRLKRDAGRSYWLPRANDRLYSESMRQQF